jgi:hypothetical protein
MEEMVRGRDRLETALVELAPVVQDALAMVGFDNYWAVFDV